MLSHARGPTRDPGAHWLGGVGAGYMREAAHLWSMLRSNPVAQRGSERGSRRVNLGVRKR